MGKKIKSYEPRIEITNIKPEQLYSCNVCGNTEKLVEIAFWNKRNQGNCIVLCDSCLRELKAKIEKVG